MDNNCFYIVKYDGEKIYFNASEIRPDSHLVTCMDFGKVIYYGEYEYECKERLNNTYYALIDKNENTDIIKNNIEISNNSLDNSNGKNTSSILIINNVDETKELNTDHLKNEKNTYYIENTNNYNEGEKSKNTYLKNDFNLSNNDSCSFGTIDKGETINELKHLIRSNIIQYISSCKVFNNSNFTVSIVPSNKIDPEEQIKKGFSAFDLGNCTNVIKDHYNISKDENFIIMNIETKNNENQKNENNIGKNTKLEIYDYSGKELNLSICKDDIKIIKYIGDVEKIDLDSAKALSDKGIDVFNAADKFFNDICYLFDNPYGKDIVINDRRNDIYQNIIFCQDGCTYNGINYDLKVVNCLCNSYTLQKEEKSIIYTKEESNEINFDSISKSFIENLFNFNFDIVKCYNLILNTKNLFRNIGFLCLLSMFILQVISFIIYLIKKTKPLKYFLLIFKINHHNDKILSENNKKNNNISKYKKIKKIIRKFKVNPPPKKGNLSKKISSETSVEKKKFIKNISNYNQDDKIHYKDDIIKESKEKRNKKNNLNLLKHLGSNLKLKSNVFISNNYAPTINIKKVNYNIYNENKTKKGINLIKDDEISNLESKDKLKRIIFSNEDNNHIIKDKKLYKIGMKQFKNIHKMETLTRKRSHYQIKNNINIGNIIKLSNTDSEIQDLDYEAAIIYDKRSYLRMYWGFLVDSQIILGTFCKDNNLDLFAIKVSFLVFTFQISFFLNAFFYTDEYISDAYHNDGVLDFFSGLPKSIYSLIATLIITNLLSMLSSSKNELIRLIKRIRQYNDYERIINKKLTKLRNKLIIYFILVFLFSSFFLYYVSLFCIIYKFSQKYWFLGCLESFGADSLIALIICIFLALLRYISIKKHIKCSYIIVKIISSFL